MRSSFIGSIATSRSAVAASLGPSSGRDRCWSGCRGVTIVGLGGDHLLERGRGLGVLLLVVQAFAVFIWASAGEPAGPAAPAATPACHEFLLERLGLVDLAGRAIGAARARFTSHIGGDPGEILLEDGDGLLMTVLPLQQRAPVQRGQIAVFDIGSRLLGGQVFWK